MRPFRRTLAVISLLAFTAQTTGAADIARLMTPAGAHVVLRAPPPNRPAPSEPVKPADEGPSWLDRIVGGAKALWEMHRSAPTMTVIIADPYRPLDATTAISAAPPVVEASPAVDRMLIVGGSGVIGAFGELDPSVLPRLRSTPYAERFTGFWSAGASVSVRVDYLEPWGVNKADAEGFTLLFKNHSPRRILSRGPVPPLLRREHPIYFAGDVVTVELTLRNDTGRTLKDVLVQSTHEGLMLDGSQGPKLGETHYAAPVDLAPGESKTMRWKITMGRANAVAGVNFDQTAVRVVGPGEDGKHKELLNVHQAGIVDPPSL